MLALDAAVVIASFAAALALRFDGDVPSESWSFFWKVADAKGAEAGQVAQLNQVPRGTLAGLWADVALVVAQEAAGGVRDVIRNQTGVRRPTPAP